MSHLPALLAAASLMLAQPAAAQQEAQPLSPAQIALFETPHLASIHTPQDLDYAFRREEEGHPPVDDRITMEVHTVHGDGRHDVYPGFLSGERHIPFPPALGFRGNPLLLFALERDVRRLAAATGGSATWFRNRIRRAFLDGAKLHETHLQAAGMEEAVPAVEIEITPFEGEPRAGRHQQRRYRFLLSQSIPGGIAAIHMIQPATDGQGKVKESVTFAGSRPR